ncbi:MAG TPA: FGGY family carbohydrate kinase, partial [Acidimicrobiales bacterium]
MTTAGGLGGPSGEERYLGVDIGTSVVKAALFDAGGTLRASAQRLTTLDHGPDGQVEADQSVTATNVGAVIAEATAGQPHPELIALTGQGDGCWLTDEHGDAVRPAISWLDGRAGSIVAAWETDGTLDATFQLTGNAIFPGCHAPLLRWLDEHEPAVLRRAATAGYCKDAIFERLTGRRATDPSDASGPFGDPADGGAYPNPVAGDPDPDAGCHHPADGGYSDRAIAACGLSAQRRLLAEVVAPVPMAALSAGGSAATGLNEGTPVTSGPFDLAAGPIGAGVRNVGDGLLTVGTTLGCGVLVDHLDLSGPPVGMHLAVGTRRWVRTLPAMAGCASIDWVLDMVGLRPGDVDGCLERTRPGAGGVGLLPYLAPSGERAPFVDPSARGQLDGLHLAATRDDLVRAACEGIALAARDCFDVTPLSGKLMVCGGGARSPRWLQLFADVLQRPLHVVATPHPAA